jgi:iron uptake system component EfeO
MQISSSMRIVRIVALLAFACVAMAGGRADAQSLAAGLKNYKPFVVEHVGIALDGAKQLQAAVKAGDAKAAQEAWKKSRKGWEAIEPIAGEFFSDLDEVIDAWPDAKRG